MATASLGAVIAFVRRLSEHDARQHTDRQLLDSFSSDRDESAFAELVRRHGPMVLATCRRMVRHEQDAEDAFQAAFLVLARKADSILQADSVAGWLYQVARRTALRVRTIGERQPAQLAALGDEIVAARPERCHDSLRLWLDTELERLPERYRSVVVLCYLEGRSQPEAARLLATTTQAINSRLKRARDLLRERVARRGWVLSAGGIAAALEANAVQGALATVSIRLTAQIALQFATNPASACGASPAALALAKGALATMIPQKLKLASFLFLAMTVLTCGALLAPHAASENPERAVSRPATGPLLTAAAAKPEDAGKPKKSCIILWMGGGPSQIDSFDPKAGNIALFKPIDTAVKGVQFTELFPRLAKEANHLAIIRSMTHRVADHTRGTNMMRTGYAEGPVDYPDVASVLAKELGDSRPDLPRYILIGSGSSFGVGGGPGFLGKEYGPLFVSLRGGFASPANSKVPLPPVEDFARLAKDKGETQRNAVAKAFDLGEEKAAVRNAYGRNPFGQGCLLARRLTAQGVPVVEVFLGGWDMHGNIGDAMKKRSEQLDGAFAELLKDLDKNKRLDSTLVVCMSEFGRTPRINDAAGRDHWPFGFTVLLAGGGVKGGRLIGKTSADATQVEERPVTPPELLATMYQSLGINFTKRYVTPDNQQIPLVEKGIEAVKEALR